MRRVMAKGYELIESLYKEKETWETFPDKPKTKANELTTSEKSLKSSL